MTSFTACLRVSSLRAPVVALCRATLLAAALGAEQAHAWNDAGHVAIALAAYDALAPAARARLDAVVGAHPRFRADFEALRPRWLDAADEASRRRWYFALASAWPDRARSFGHVRDARERAALVRLHDRPTWHYVNLPTYLAAGDRRALALASPRLDLPDHVKAGAMNIVQALESVERQWRRGPDDGARALALCWLLHLVSDLHQPLHATSLYATGALAEGDRGGNRITVGGDNLHALWDGALGSSRRRADIERVAASLGKRPAAARVVDFAAWARESQSIAAKAVYTPAVRAALEYERIARLPVQVAAIAGYDAGMRSIARERATLAAARLAALLDALARSSE
jgi:hypothetical protein